VFSRESRGVRNQKEEVKWQPNFGMSMSSIQNKSNSSEMEFESVLSGQQKGNPHLGNFNKDLRIPVKAWKESSDVPMNLEEFEDDEINLLKAVSTNWAEILE